jgi:hypothetical protein
METGLIDMRIDRTPLGVERGDETRPPAVADVVRSVTGPAALRRNRAILRR